MTFTSGGTFIFMLLGCLHRLQDSILHPSSYANTTARSPTRTTRGCHSARVRHVYYDPPHPGNKEFQNNFDERTAGVSPPRTSLSPSAVSQRTIPAQSGVGQRYNDMSQGDRVCPDCNGWVWGSRTQCISEICQCKPQVTHTNSKVIPRTTFSKVRTNRQTGEECHLVLSLTTFGMTFDTVWADKVSGEEFHLKT